MLREVGLDAAGIESAVRARLRTLRPNYADSVLGPASSLAR
jgi:hypothetical protein